MSLQDNVQSSNNIRKFISCKHFLTTCDKFQSWFPNDLIDGNFEKNLNYVFTS